MLRLPDKGEKFAADALLARLRTSHHTTGGGDDGNAKPTEDAGNVLGRNVLAAPRLGAALHVGDNRLALGGKLGLYLDLLLG